MLLTYMYVVARLRLSPSGPSGGDELSARLQYAPQLVAVLGLRGLSLT